ncbi:hypothetical protein SOCE26_015220 [Sorangium cellulosum]|uniref:Secreted protein n=1 Tax=Sorangium cellulosum TaxID=56 RepID=A0A2L0ELG0_SORCE|nr:hypothetical protein [Sorangium cellulosum]AUX40125.1 hypothetical protein SOCE26_015220 [Sorangium cellulosum]
MKAKRLLGAAVAVGLGLAAIASTNVVAAQPKGGKKAPAAAAAASARPAEPPVTKKTIALNPQGITWGMSTKQVAALVDKMLDAAYVPRYKATSPGVKMRALDAELAEEKSAFRRSRIDFGKLPTGIDTTPLKGEYTYLNKESMMTLTQGEGKRHFFFIQDKLWKIIDEHALGEGNPRGKDFQSAAIKLATAFGVPGRVTPPDPDKGRFITEVDWKDAATHFRAIDRGEGAIAFAYEDLVTLSSLDSLRPNKPQDANAIDPAVASAIRKDEPAPAPPPTDKKK